MNDEPATKQDLLAVKQDVLAVKDDVLAVKEDILNAVKDLKEYIDERTHDTETRLLRAFSDYQTAHEVRFRKMKADVSNIDASTDQRLTQLEERVLQMDKRLIAKGI
jgi:hypothetical protein